MDSKFPKNISNMRKDELRNTFKRMVEYAQNAQINVIILAGDVFDSDTPFKKDKDFFYSVVRNNPQIDFLYLRGNHDVSADYEGEHIANLKVFSNKWTSYSYGNVVISGIEISAENSSALYSSLSLDKDKINIVTLHGDIGDASGKDKINKKKLRDKNIDYLALGHIHKHRMEKLDDRGTYCYSGCLEGRGFDELGDHGFVVLDIDKKVLPTFVPFAKRKIIEADADVSGVRDGYEAYSAVKSAVSFDKENIYRINLKGELDFDVEPLAADVASYLASSDCLFADVKDMTGKKLNVGDFEGDMSLRGEFVRCVYEDGECSDEDKAKIISYGLKALAGGDWK